MYRLPNLGRGKQRHHPHKVTRGVFSPYCTCSLGLQRFRRVRSHNCPKRRSPAPLLAGPLPLQQFSWQDVSIIAAAAVNCVARVIVRGVKREKKKKHVQRRHRHKKRLLSHNGRMPRLCPLLICPGSVATVSVFVTMSALPRRGPLRPSQA